MKDFKMEADLFIFAMVVMVGIIVSTAAIILFPTIGMTIELIFFLLVAAAVLKFLVPDVIEDLRRK